MEDRGIYDCVDKDTVVMKFNVTIPGIRMSKSCLYGDFFKGVHKYQLLLYKTMFVTA